MSILNLREVSLTYRSKHILTRALDSVNLTAERGEYIIVRGSSGSGKSSLLSILGLLQRPTSGEIYFSGARADGLSEGKRTALRRGSIGFVFQDFQLIDYLNVQENVALAAVYAGFGRKEALASADLFLESVGLAHRRLHLPSELSGGQRQRVAVARALIIKPKLILADEPTGNLDPVSGALVLRALADAASDGAAVVVVTHAPELSPTFSRILAIQAGRLSSMTSMQSNENANEIQLAS